MLQCYIVRTSLLAANASCGGPGACTPAHRSAQSSSKAGMHVLYMSACSQPKVRWGNVKKSGKSHTGNRTAARIDEALQVEISDMHHVKGDNSTPPNCHRHVK